MARTRTARPDAYTRVTDKVEQEYTVSWSIQLTADSAEDAARKALAIHRNPDSTATVFDVYAADDDATPLATVDLSERCDPPSDERYF